MRTNKKEGTNKKEPNMCGSVEAKEMAEQQSHPLLDLI
jgi:hypothetical protein